MNKPSIRVAWVGAVRRLSFPQCSGAREQAVRFKDAGKTCGRISWTGVRAATTATSLKLFFLFASQCNNQPNCAATKVLAQEKLKTALKIKSVVLSIEQRGELSSLQIRS